MKSGIKTKRRGIVAGFTLVEIMIVVAVIGILLAIALPGWFRARARARSETCSQNLAQIDGAKEVWAFQLNKASGDPVQADDLYGPNNYVRKAPACPGGGTYTINPVSVPPECTLSADGHFLRN